MSSSSNNNDPADASTHNNNGLNVCGMDFDNLCVHPDMIEDDGQERDLENPMAYRHTSSGLQNFKDDMYQSMMVEQQRAQMQFAMMKDNNNTNKKKFGGFWNRKNSTATDGGSVAEDYRPDSI